MDLFTVDRDFQKDEVIDKYHSVIWNEKYYGDSDVELVVPADDKDLAQVLAPGTFLGETDSPELMMLETHDVEEGIRKIPGISLLKWMNNRFIRTTDKHQDRFWNLSGMSPGETMKHILFNFCISGPWLSGANNMGVYIPSAFVVPGLSISSWDDTDSDISVAVPFGPVFDPMRELAETYKIGQTIFWDPSDSVSPIKYRNYKGLDRSSDQAIRPVIRFSPDMESFTDIKELDSIEQYRNLSYVFAPGMPETFPAAAPGHQISNPPLDGSGNTYPSFDLRAVLVFADDITTDQIGGSAATLTNLLNERATTAVFRDYKRVNLVDGEIVPTDMVKFRTNYGLGDIVEVQGYSEITKKARILEYIRSKDATGEKAYPTLEMLD